MHGELLFQQSSKKKMSNERENNYRMENDTQTIERMTVERISDLEEFDNGIEPIRMEFDYFWGLLTSDSDKRTALIDMIVGMWLDMFPPNGDESKGPRLGGEVLQILRKVQKTKHRAVQDTFIFFSMYLHPKVYTWFMQLKNPETGQSLIVDSNRYRYFVNNILARECANFLDSNQDTSINNIKNNETSSTIQTCPIRNFARQIRFHYIHNVFVYVPPAEYYYEKLEQVRKKQKKTNLMITYDP